MNMNHRNQNMKNNSLNGNTYNRLLRTIYKSFRNYRRYSKVSIVLMASVIFFSIIFSAGHVYAKGSDDNRVKLYKSVLIYSGDTFESIAEKYMTEDYSSVNKYTTEVANINNLSTSSKLIPGNHIIVPYYVDAIDTDLLEGSNDIDVNSDFELKITIERVSN